MAMRSAWRRVPRPVRIGLWSLAGLIGIAVVALVIFLASFDANSLKPRIVAAVKQATGRDLALNGSIGLGLSLQPTLVVRDVAFSNPPGFTGAQMATLERLDLKLALLPLLSHRIEIDRLILVRPNIQLETDNKGQTNWEFTPLGAAPAQTTEPTSASSSTAPMQIGISAVKIEDGTLSYHDGVTGSRTVLGVKSLKADAATPDANLSLSADASYNGTAFSLNGEMGPLTRLQDPAAVTPWPVQLTLASGGAKLSVDGTLTKPLQGRGYKVKLNGSVPDLAALAPFLPGQTLPPLHDITVSAQVADSGGTLPEISSLSLHVGKSDLSGAVAGLQVGTLDITAARFDQPAKLSGQGSLNNVPLTLAATLGAPGSLLPGAKPGGPFPVDVSLQAGGSSLAVKGEIADPQHLGGINLAATGNIADLAALSPLAHQSLPDLKSVSLQAELHDGDGGLTKGVVLRNVKLAMPQGDLTGDVTVGLSTPPSLQATLKSDKIDADGLLAAMKKTPEVAGSAQGAPAAPHPATSNRMIPDTPIPFALLRRANADVTFNGNELRYGGAAYRAIALHVVLRDGNLLLDPFSADAPQGHGSGTLSVDATRDPAAVALRLNAPGLALGSLLTSLGMAGYANGNLEVYANLHGTGDTPQAIAASVDGSVGLAMANGTVDNRLLGSALGSILRAVNLLDLVGRGGSSQVQCFATRVDLNRGVGTFRTLLLSSTLLTMDGTGSINLGPETLDMRLRPQAQVIAASVVVPLRVTGSIRSPSVVPDPAATVADNAGTVAGAVITKTTPLGLLAGALGGDKVIQKVLGGGVDCGASLAIARAQSGAAAPARATAQPAATPQQAAPKSKPAGPGGLLNQLFR